MPTTIIPVTAGFFLDDTVTPATASDLETAVADAQAIVDVSIADATAAATAALASQTAAAASAVAALASQSSATTSASSATTSASSATSSASAASTSASSATTSQNAASASATAADASATAAATSATTASTAATTATTQAGNAASSATAAANSAAAAAASAATLSFTSPGPIGSVAPGTGAFTTLAASSTVSGAGFDAYLALGTKPASFTTLAASSTVSGAGFTARFATPGPIGNTVASTGAFTTLSSSSTTTLKGTTAGGNQTAGNIGEFVQAGNNAGVSSTVTITIAAPGVVTWTSHPYINNQGTAAVVFTTTGALPTGIVAGTTYYVIPSTMTANTFQIATTAANALAGTAITTTGSQSGVQTGVADAFPGASATTKCVAALSLTAGDWDIEANLNWTVNGSTMTAANALISTTTDSVLAGGDVTLQGFVIWAGSVAAGNVIQPTGRRRVSISGTTTYFLNAFSTYTGGSGVSFSGSLNARRVI